MTVDRGALTDAIAAAILGRPVRDGDVAELDTAVDVVEALARRGWAVIDARAAVAGVLAELGVPEFTCAGPTPGLHCGRVTHHPTDVTEGYCPSCHHFCSTAEQVRRGHRPPSTVDGPPSTVVATGP